MRQYKLLEAESATELSQLVTAMLAMRQGPPPHLYAWAVHGNPFAAIGLDGRQRFYQAMESF